jgi:hypothetical protein
MHSLPTPSQIIINLFCTFQILNHNFLLLDIETSLCKTTADFATVGAMAYVPSSAGEELVVIDGHAYGATEARAD